MSLYKLPVTFIQPGVPNRLRLFLELRHRTENPKLLNGSFGADAAQVFRMSRNMDPKQIQSSRGKDKTSQNLSPLLLHTGKMP